MSSDNQENMKGKLKEVQAHITHKNPEKPYVPCFAHSLSYVVGDGAKASTIAICYLALFKRYTPYLVLLHCSGIFFRNSCQQSQRQDQRQHRKDVGEQLKHFGTNLGEYAMYNFKSRTQVMPW